jgi:DNA-binding response OmpR family regulator
MSQLIYVADDENGDSLLSAFAARPADMVILDIMMEGTDGLAVCARLRRDHHVPIIIVSARDSELDRITGISMGSDDYLVKPFSPIELVARVKAIFRRIQLDSERSTGPLLHFGGLALNTGVRTAVLNGKRLELTPTEFSLMTYLIVHRDRAVSREELLKNVWQFDFDVDTRAADDVVKRLRKKLAGGDVRIASVWGYGFKLEREESP